MMTRCPAKLGNFTTNPVCGAHRCRKPEGHADEIHRCCDMLWRSTEEPTEEKS